MKRKIVIILCLGVVFFTNIQLSQAESENLANFSDASQFFIPLATLTIATAKEDEEGLVQLTEGFLITQGLTLLGKTAIHKKRPNGANYKSFPSGHTSWAFSGAAFIHHRYGFKWSIPFYLSAAAVGYQRVESKAHDTLDVLSGAALAYAVSYLITDRYCPVKITPLIDPENRAYAATISFDF